MFAGSKQCHAITTARLFSTLAFCIMISACSQEKSSATNFLNEEASAIDQQAARKAQAQMAALSFEELRKLASNSFREQRLYAPAGNNAVEYYLAIRKKSEQPDPLTESALMDLTPYTVIAAEQAISRNDFAEASRLRDLIAAIDANAPALPRISLAISDGLRNIEALATAKAKEDEDTLPVAAVKTQQEAMQPIATEPAIKPTQSVIQAPNTSASITSAPPQNISIPAPSPSVPSTNAAPLMSATAKKAELIAIRTPDPAFPSDLLNRGLSGAVEIEFVVQRSGEVSEVRVLNSSQRAFDRNVVLTVKRWKFGPLDEPITVRRSFNFNNPS
jgi:protein TonB